MKLNEQIEMTFESSLNEQETTKRNVVEKPRAKWWFAQMRQIVSSAPDMPTRQSREPEFSEGLGLRLN